MDLRRNQAAVQSGWENARRSSGGCCIKKWSVARGDIEGGNLFRLLLASKFQEHDGLLFGRCQAKNLRAAQNAELAMRTRWQVLVIRLMSRAVRRANAIADIRQKLSLGAHRRSGEHRDENGQQHCKAQHKRDGPRMMPHLCCCFFHLRKKVRANQGAGSSLKSAMRGWA